MSTLITGLHHATSGVSTAQEDIDFFTQIVGQRMIKQTVLYDGGVPIYHLYYANKHAEIGSVMTTFPFKQVGYVGKKGSGQVGATCYSVPVGSLGFWQAHFKKHGVKTDPLTSRFNQKVLPFYHPTGLEFELIEDADDKTEGFETEHIKSDVAVRGFHSICMSVRDQEEMDFFLTKGLGLEEHGTDGKYARYTIGDGGAQRIIDLRVDADKPQGSWHFAQGIVHHVAFAVPNDKVQAEVKAHLEGIGFTDCSESKDRTYFHSVYCRSPGGVLCEIATSDIGFGIDEPMEHLGEKLLLPPWYEAKRAEIVAPLEPIDVPKYHPVVN